MRGAPELDEHPVLHAAYAAVGDPIEQWRCFYRMPPTDPRYLDATEEQIFHDLLVQRYLDDDTAMRANPSIAEADEPGVVEKYQAKKQAIIASGLISKGISLSRGGAKQPRGPMTITFKRREGPV